MNSFEQDDRDFAEMIFKNAANQDFFGPAMGNEIERDILVDRIQRPHNIKMCRTGIINDDNGIPYLVKERIGKIIDCGHMVNSLEQVLGQCIYGHLVCTRCQLYICEWCGAKVCEDCVIITQGGIVLCPEHEFRRKLKAIQVFLFG
ncbi:MAG: hypothetical protein ABIA75_01895 [Candidatus Neomarinimicrobiota bacterium]